MIEWTDRDGTQNILVTTPLEFWTDPLPEPHDYDPMIRRYMTGLEQRGPECLGCLPYGFPEDHPIHAHLEPGVAKAAVGR